MKTVLKILWIYQEKPGWSKEIPLMVTKRRLNPYNPLTYIFMILVIVICLILHGIAGTLDRIKNPLNEMKWH